MIIIGISKIRPVERDIILHARWYWLCRHQSLFKIGFGRYVMFYEGVAEDDTRSISLAVSKDGQKGWKCLGSPILSTDGSSTWDSGGVGGPCAVSMDGKQLLL